MPWNWREALGIGTSAVVALVTFLMAAPLDPEPYHDGSQLPSAIAASEGLIVHRDVFSGYGFITAWLQGFAVDLFGAHLLTIRIFTALTLVIVTMLIFVIARWALRSALIAAGVASLWVVAWPGQSVSWGTPLLPWPSVVYLGFQLGAVIFVARALLIHRHRSWVLGIAGAFAGLSVLTRINYGFVFTIALTLTIVMFARSTRLSKRNLGAAVLGFAVALFVPLCVIALQGGFPAFLDQSIIGPLEGKAIIKATEWFYLKNAYVWGSALLLVSLLVIVWAGTRKWISDKVFAALVVLDVLGLVLWTSTAIEGSPIRNLILTKVTWAPALDGQAMQPLFLAALVTLVPVAAIVANVVIKLLKREPLVVASDESTLRNRIFLVLLALTSAASLVQLYPVADPNHLWWAAPLPLVLLVFAATFAVTSRTRWAIAAAIIVPGLVVSLATARVFWEKPRVSIETGVLSGMRITTSLKANIDKVDAMLMDVAPRSAQFNCKEGLFAVWNGKYLSAGPGYVDYAYNLDSADAGAKPQRTFLCAQWGDTEKLRQFTRDHDMHVVRESGQVVLSYFTDINIVELAPNN